MGAERFDERCLLLADVVKVQLVETEFHHIKIDKCPDCKGIWFDNGEVEMLEHVDQSNVRQFMRSMFGLKW